ncbi:MAG TPA: hypothetical protein VMF64_06485, partial [Steroidobacteraceae bacterium]|nr:hypothetical protein [Steroidobacteraceae bacterium]
ARDWMPVSASVYRRRRVNCVRYSIGTRHSSRRRAGAAGAVVPPATEPLSHYRIVTSSSALVG